ncbi:hypothetical protein TgHK011_002244 [Trichoderma gracile]|nr:hypothetical protein TgHK011_002244 [Trichoderma gracile]
MKPMADIAVNMARVILHRLSNRLTDSPLPTELLDYDGFDAFQHHFMLLPSFAFAGFFGFLYHFSNIIWARLQRKIILSLKAPSAISPGLEEPNSDSKDDSKANNHNQYEANRGPLSYLGFGLLGLMYFTMYIDYIEVKYDGLAAKKKYDERWDRITDRDVAGVVQDMADIHETTLDAVHEFRPGFK